MYLKELAQPSRNAHRSLTRLGQLLVVLDHLAPALAFAKPGQALPETHPAVIAATELLDAAPEYPWTLAELAERVHISASYLCRLFTRELGISPLHYLERHRLETLGARQVVVQSPPVACRGDQLNADGPNEPSTTDPATSTRRILCVRA